MAQCLRVGTKSCLDILAFSTKLICRVGPMTKDTLTELRTTRLLPLEVATHFCGPESPQSGGSGSIRIHPFPSLPTQPLKLIFPCLRPVESTGVEGGEGKGQTGLPGSSLLCTEGQTITMRGEPWEAEDSLLKNTRMLLPCCV